MRVLVVHPHLYVVGGSEVLTRLLVYEMEKLGCEVVVASSGFREEAFRETERVKLERFRSAGVEVASRDELRREMLKRIMDVWYTMASLVEEYDPDVSLVMIQEPLYVAALKAARPELGVGIYIHFPFEEELTKENLPRFIAMYRFPNMYNNLYGVADLHLVNSNYTARALYKHYGIEANVVYPAVDWDYFMEEPDVEEDRDDVIISVARFVPQKRLDVLVKLYAEKIKPAHPRARLLLVGIKDERYEDYFNRLVAEAEKAGDVEIVAKPLTPRELVRYYREAKVYVHMRIGEHFGMAPVEAMSQATIPIVPRKSGLAELIVEGLDGYTYTSDEGVVAYTLKVLRMGRDELVKMRRYAVRKAWRFTPANFAREVLAYLRIVAREQAS